jgi:chaperone modulatory protein CbpM
MTTTITGQVLDDTIELTIVEISQACSLSTVQIVELVKEGVLEPIGDDPDSWRFRATSLVKARIAMRLQRDLGVNPAGVALALDLLGEIEALRSRLRRQRSA